MKGPSRNVNRREKKRNYNRLHKLLKGKEGRFLLLVNGLGVDYQKYTDQGSANFLSVKSQRIF